MNFEILLIMERVKIKRNMNPQKEGVWKRKKKGKEKVKV